MEMARKLTVSMLRVMVMMLIKNGDGNYLIGLANNGDAEEVDCVHVESDGYDVDVRMGTVIT